MIGIFREVLDIAQWSVFGLPIGLYGFIALSYIFSKVLLSFRYKPYVGATADEPPSAAVIIPEYNEDPDLFRRGIQSVVECDYPVEEVWVIDDGSSDTRAWEVAQEYAAAYDFIKAVRLDENQGKRHAQAYGFNHAKEVDVFVTMDSDTVLDTNSIRELVRPFATEEDVMAVTGYPRVINSDVNLLTRLIDMRYWVAFNVERAAQSVLGVVVCCCGVLSAYRYDMVVENVDEYTGQTFIGSECTFGDDRHLTSIALREGRVLYQSTATSLTDAPETIRGYLTQQTRWMRSFWRESALALGWSHKRSWALTTMLVIDLLLPFALVTIGFGFVMVRSLTLGSTIPMFYIAVIMGIAYVRNAPYGSVDLKTFAMSPLYAAFYLAILLPLSFYALATITASGWGTR